MKSNSFNKILKELEEEFKLNQIDTRRIANSVFEFTAHTIAEGENSPILLTGLGTFKVKPMRKATRKQKEQYNEELRRRKNKE